MAERSKERLDELVRLNLEGAKTAPRPAGVDPIVPKTASGQTLHRGRKATTKYNKGGKVKGQCRDYSK